MIDPLRNFQQLMDDLEKSSELKFVRAESGTEWVVPLTGGAVELNVAYRPATDQIITFAEVCPLGETADYEGRARMLLEMNWQWKESHGFTLSIDDETQRLMIADRRAARHFATPESFGAYLAEAGTFIKELRQVLLEFDELAMADAEGRLDELVSEEEEI